VTPLVARREATAHAPDPSTPIAEIMTQTVHCVRPETPLDEVLDLLVRHSISGVPVVDTCGRAVGIVSRADLLRARQEDGETSEMRPVTAMPRQHDGSDFGLGMYVLEPVSVTAEAVMTPVVLALPESANVGQAAALMAYEGVHRLPVVADGGEVVGILSAIDVLRWFGSLSGYFIPPGRRA
jgi:CBS domain-containing protein